MTLVVLALDALDAGLVDYWDLEPFRLSAHGEIETYAHMHDVPYTPEVWATMATGLGPEEHGVTGAGLSSWDNPVVDFASRFTGVLPLWLRIRLGELVGGATGSEYSVGETDAPSVFDGEGRVVHNWPGVVDGEALAEVWRVFSLKDELSVGEYERRIYGIGAGKLAWAEEMLAHDPALAAVHVHTLDALGHVHASDEARLRAAYEWTARWVDRVRSAMDPDDDLAILSDHGMAVSFYDDDRDPGVAQHSWRAFASSTFGSIPGDVYGVREWLSAHVGEYEDDSGDLELPEEQLRQLGYIE